MSYDNHQTINSKNGIIYFSNSKDSIPYKTYINMQQEFWHHQLNLSQKHSLIHNDITNNIIRDDSLNCNTSSIDLSTGIDSPSDSNIKRKFRKLKLPSQESVNMLNTSENNEGINQNFDSKLIIQDTTSHVIPLSVDMSTQFNSNMKIIIEQDLYDKNVVNIRFGGTFTGSMTGTGTIPHDTLKSILNEAKKDQKPTESTTPLIINQNKEQSKVTNVKTVASKTKRASGIEESVSYFASTKPVELFVTKSNDRASESIVKDPDILSSNLRTDVTINSVSKFGASSVTQAQYNEPFTEGETSMMPSVSYYSSQKSIPTVPAVLPTCIVRRILQAVLIDLQLPKNRVSNPLKLELKIKSLTKKMEILYLNWHSAIKQGRIMIGELIELILSVNIDGSNKSLDEVQEVLLELKNEFVGCCVYLVKLIDDKQIKDKICLELMIDLMSKEIDKLVALYGEWKKINVNTDFSAYFNKYFRNTLSPDISDDYSTEGITTTTATTLTSTKQQKKEVSQTQSLKGNRKSNTMSSKSSVDLINDQSEGGAHDGKILIDQRMSYNDPSIITNSRIRKTMITISQLAMEQNLSHTSISKESRKQILPLELIGEHLILKKNLDISIIKVLNKETKLWQKPITAGMTSIQDLIEFIINTIAQDKMTSKELYGKIINELNHLESELLLSVSKNLHDCRVSDDDLSSLCYEILAEIIYEEMAAARYMFHSLDVKGIDNTMLGKLFRNYTKDNLRIQENFKLPTAGENYAHLTSEVMNYNEEIRNKVEAQLIRVTQIEENSMNQAIKQTLIPDVETDKKELSQLNSLSEDMKSNLENLIKFTPIIDKQNRSNQDDVSNLGGSNQLLLIINKLNNQTNEINKIKETLQVLSGCVEEKLSSWTCNYLGRNSDKLNSEIVNKANKFYYSKTTNLYNDQELIEPPVDLVKNIQPSKHIFLSEMGLNATTIENKSYIAPIYSQTIEQKVNTPQASRKPFTNEQIDFDLLQLIGDGAHNFLTTKQLANKIPDKFQRDSCKSFNTEFDKIFEWICHKYQENLSLMMANSGSRPIVNVLNTAPLDEKRKIERELINRIIEENNYSINNWLKDICFKKVLNYLS